MTKLWLLLRAQNLAKSLGYVVRPNTLCSRDDWRLFRFLEVNKIDTVLDVGANRGQYALDLLRIGYNGKIVSFEALPHVYAQLQQAATKYPARWTVAPRCALGDEEGTVQFHVTNGISSSSMLRPTDVSEHIPDIFSVRETIEVESKRLDDMVHRLDIRSEQIFLKLDVQGAEQKVLNGAKAFMSRVKGLVIEMPLRRYYENQPLARELDSDLVQQGFELWDIVPVWRFPDTGRLDYFDAVYFRKDTPRMETL